MLPLKYSTPVICVLFIITAVSGKDETKAVGDTVSFGPTNINPSVTSIIWKHKNSTGIVVKAIEWDDDGINIPNKRFIGFTTLDEKTGQITITKLTVEHSGVYTIDINSKEQEQRFNLKVLERVTKPEINIEISTNPDVAYLRCGNNEGIIWKNSTGQILIGSKNHQPGEFITVKNTRNPENFYTCTLKNAVSEQTSDPVYEKELFGTESNPGLIGGIIFFVLLLLLLPIILICVYLLSDPIYKSVNKSYPWIEGPLGLVDCCANWRAKYKPTAKDDEMKDSPSSSDSANQKKGEENTASDKPQTPNEP